MVADGDLLVQDHGGSSDPRVQKDVERFSLADCSNIIAVGGEGEEERGIVVDMLDCDRHVHK